MTGRWWFAVPRSGPPQQFRTPFGAFLALDQAHVEGDLYTQNGDYPLVHMGHRTKQGEWR